MEADRRTFKRDTKNPDPALRSWSLKGIIFVSGLKWSPREQRWESGKLYDGSSGQTYTGRAKMVGNKLEMRGYMGVPLLGATIGPDPT